jgi:hypothetical protein
MDGMGRRALYSSVGPQAPEGVGSDGLLRRKHLLERLGGL